MAEVGGQGRRRRFGQLLAPIVQVLLHLWCGDFSPLPKGIIDVLQGRLGQGRGLSLGKRLVKSGKFLPK